MLPTKGRQPEPYELELDTSHFGPDVSTLTDASEWMSKLTTSDTLLEDRDQTDQTEAICQLQPRSGTAPK